MTMRLAAVLLLICLQIGCAHENGSTPAGFTTIRIGGGTAQSLQRAGKLSLLDALGSPAGLSATCWRKPGIFTIPTGSSGGVMVFAQLLGGGQGALFVPTNSGPVSWTLPTALITFRP